MSAFHLALSMMNKAKDNLFIFSAVHDPFNVMSRTDEFMETFGVSVADKFEVKARSRLSDFHDLATEQGCKHVFLIMSYASHVGDAVCKVAAAKEANFLVLGTRGLTGLTGFAVGSTCQYCIAHAPCPCVVVPGEYGPEEIHVSKAEVIEMEERERRRRILREKIDEEVARKLEKDERAKTLKEVQQAEEAERKRRIEEEKIIEQRAHHVKDPLIPIEVVHHQA